MPKQKHKIENIKLNSEIVEIGPDQIEIVQEKSTTNKELIDSLNKIRGSIFPETREEKQCHPLFRCQLKTR